MKILKDDGKFEVISKTDDIIGQIATAARTCYKSCDKSTPENDKKLVKNLLNRGHEAMIEFADMTVRFSDISRGFSHEAVRHRAGTSFAQQSTRYVDESDFSMVVPPHCDETAHYDQRKIVDGRKTSEMVWSGSFEECLESAEKSYKMFRAAKYKPEDCRQLLPIGISTEICIKANLREWIHIFHMRCENYAHWEIRSVMLRLLKWCQENIPLIFDDFHFFKTKDGKDYAKRITSDFKIKDNLKHLVGAKPEEKEQLIKYIESL